MIWGTGKRTDVADRTNTYDNFFVLRGLYMQVKDLHIALTLGVILTLR